MALADRAKWDERHGRGQDGVAPRWLEEHAGLLPVAGRALDVACGRGRVALWLAARGLRTLAIDVSAVGLERARERAKAQGLSLQTAELDLEQAALPAGPFDCISCLHYLQRDLFPAMIERLSPGGMLLVELHTADNLRKHAHPSERFLLRPGELARLIAPLQPLYCFEGWAGDHALARCIARKQS